MSLLVVFVLWWKFVMAALVLNAAVLNGVCV